MFTSSENAAALTCIRGCERAWYACLCARCVCSRVLGLCVVCAVRVRVCVCVRAPVAHEFLLWHSAELLKLVVSYNIGFCRG